MSRAVARCRQDGFVDNVDDEVSVGQDAWHPNVEAANGAMLACNLIIILLYYNYNHMLIYIYIYWSVNLRMIILPSYFHNIRSYIYHIKSYMLSHIIRVSYDQSSLFFKWPRDFRLSDRCLTHIGMIFAQLLWCGVWSIAGWSLACRKTFPNRTCVTLCVHVTICKNHIEHRIWRY
jgi:hypothetical protein